MAHVQIATWTTRIVAGYVRRHHVGLGEVVPLIDTVAAALGDVVAPRQSTVEVGRPSKRTIARSIGPDYITSFENGRRYKNLTRHLSAVGLSPEEYRRKWGLPVAYPMTAPDYSAVRSEIARANGLGSRRQRGFDSAPAPSDGPLGQDQLSGQTAANAASHPRPNRLRNNGPDAPA